MERIKKKKCDVRLMIYSGFTQLYECLHDQEHIHTRFLTPIRVLVRYMANAVLPFVLENQKPSSQANKRAPNLIVSLTSFPKRINKVYLTIYGILCQTVLPSKIILWLSKEQFSSIEDLPLSLKNLQNDIFQIRLVDDDLRSYKKFYYAFGEYKNSLILTIDDDLLYSTTLIERIMSEHNNYPNDVICAFGLNMKYNDENVLLPYKDWSVIPYKRTCGNKVFFGSGGGTLFRPSLLHEDVLKQELFNNLCPKADDVWLNLMVRLSGLNIIKVNYGMYLPVFNKSDEKLCSYNDSQGGNEIQIENVVSYYKKNGVCITPFS